MLLLVLQTSTYTKKKLVGNAILSRSIEKTFLGNNTFEGFNKLFSALL